MLAAAFIAAVEIACRPQNAQPLRIRCPIRAHKRFLIQEFCSPANLVNPMTYGYLKVYLMALSIFAGGVSAGTSHQCFLEQLEAGLFSLAA